MPDEQRTVFVVDDDLGIREAVTGTVKSVGLRVETFESPQAFLSFDRPPGPSCLVLDVRLPGLSGLDVQRELAIANIDIPIVFVSGHGDIPMTVRAMKAGAVEFLTKPFREQDLLDAIHEALGRDLVMRTKRSHIDGLRRRFETLTDRERQVLRLIVVGKLNKEIAAELRIAEVTVKVQRSHLMQKMRAQSAIDLVRMAEKLDSDSEL